MRPPVRAAAAAAAAVFGLASPGPATAPGVIFAGTSPPGDLVPAPLMPGDPLPVVGLRSAAAMDPPPAPGTCGMGEDHHSDGWGNVQIACPAGETVAEVLFASWGNWKADCSGYTCEVKENANQCNGAGCNGGTTCACPCKGFIAAGTESCASCSWSVGECAGASAKPYVEGKCLGKAKCGPFPANNGNEYDGKGKGDPCPGKSKHLGIAVRCCPASGCPVGGGAEFVIALGLLAAAYIGGGIGVGVKQQGKPVGLAAHPHHGRFVELGALVHDGVAFARSNGRVKAGGGGRPAGSAPSTKAGPAAPSSGSPMDAGKSGSSKKSKGRGSGSKGKKSKGEKQEKLLPGGVSGAAASPAAAAPASPASEGGAAKSAPSGGGGRWVHMPA
eukprot:SAG22_NODE_153_length_17315_cov_69.981935_7_plen_387_part_00